jgi:threonine dehydratase
MSAVRELRLLSAAAEAIGPPESGIVCPADDLLDRARHLQTLFPTAGLRPVALLRAQGLDARAGCRVWLAFEVLQVTGSFKVRGALLAIDELRRRGHTRAIAASAGNHGAGVAHAARVLGFDVTVVVPKTAPKTKIERIARGARLHLSASSHYDGAEQEAREMAQREGVPFLSPYDDLAVVAGNGASIGFELFRDLGRVPDTVLVPIGGGGLATGLACALLLEADRTGQPRPRVFGVQSEASPAMALSVARGAAVEVLEPLGPTLAEGLEGGISRAGFERARAVLAGVLVVSEASIGHAMVAMSRTTGLQIEGSAAAALAPLLDDLPAAVRARDPDTDLVVVLTGGNVDASVFQKLEDDNADVAKLW